MRVAFHLRRSQPEPATAVLLLSHQTAALLQLLVQLRCDPLPPAYVVADGFLVKLTRPAPEATVGTIRLRSVAENLLVPVDADLVPALLPDEAVALVRDRGLLFLPGGRVLAFDPKQPLPLSALLQLGPLQHREWQAVPAPRPLAERLLEIVPPPTLLEEVLERGGEEIAVEEPEPPQSGLPARSLGNTTLGLGQGLTWLGKSLGLRWLGNAGAQLIGKALAMAPKLSEKLLGEQEARLRDLLRDFRSGAIERALRRALPLGGGTQRGATTANDAQLPTHDVRYSLRTLLGDNGPPGVWWTSQDTWAELILEYRKQAELAAQRGDHRRAAFIYGKLLGDYLAAARVLAAGGLHADAATIYLHKLADSLTAAREFEHAGDIDQALQLYRQRGEHALAGDLLRRAGEDERATREYEQAAAQLVAQGQGHYQAGELLRERAGRPDLARAYYAAGWLKRPLGSPFPCAVRLAEWHAAEANTNQLLALVAAADAFLRAAPATVDATAGEFYNGLARLAEQPALAAARAELRDRALLGLATLLRQRVQAGAATGHLVSTMLGQGTAWVPSQISDAQFAVKRESHQRQKATARRTATTPLSARIRLLRSVCQAPGTGEIFAGFESGEVFSYRPLTGEVNRLAEEQGPVISLAVSPSGDMLIALFQEGTGSGLLANYQLHSGFRIRTAHLVELTDTAWLCPVVEEYGVGAVVGLWNGRGLKILECPSLLPLPGEILFRAESAPLVGLLLTYTDPLCPGIMPLVCYLDGLLWYPRLESTNRLMRINLAWAPSRRDYNGLASPVLAWNRSGEQGLSLAGVNDNGQVYCSELLHNASGLEHVRTSGSRGGEDYLAATIVRPGQLAGVTRTGVNWLIRGALPLKVVGTSAIDLPPVVACFPHLPSNQLVLLCYDGTVGQVLLPGR